MRDRPVRDADRLSDFEALLWTLERDPRFASGFANITLLDRPADPARMRARMTHAAAVVPQLRRRILPDPLGLATPRWVDDPDFSIGRHVRVRTLAAPGDTDRLVATALEFCNRAWDGDHPLWEFLLVDGLADGRGAMLQRFHHTIADGVGMMRMSEFFIDLERDVDTTDIDELPSAVAPPGVLRASGDAVAHNLGRLTGALRSGVTRTGDLICNPSRLGSGARTALDTGTALGRELTAMTHRRSSVFSGGDDGRALFLLRVPFDAVRATADRHRVSINDVFVAGIAGGAGTYHRTVGTAVDHLRMAMPVSTRRDHAAGGNAFGMARTSVPTDPDPVARLAAVHDSLTGVRGVAAVSLIEHLAGVANLLPARLLAEVTRSQTASVDFTSSNVRGAPFPVFMAGARVESNHPIGPLAGTPFNLTMLSYNGSLDMGLHIDTGAVDRPELLATSIEESFAELVGI